MSIKILSSTDTGRLIPFLLISILLHISILLIIPQAREEQNVLPRLIPVDVIESQQPAKAEDKKEKIEKKEGRKEVRQHHPPSKPLPSFPEEKRVKKTLIDESKPVKEDRVKETEQKSGAGEEKEPLPSAPIAKEEKPVTLFPTRERLAELSKEYERQTPAAEEGKDLSFDTSEPRYASYLEGLKGKIYHEWGYPSPAAREGQAGKLYIRFTILKDGTLEEAVLVKSSGYPILDDAALSAIRLAAPFYAFPKTFGSLGRITINASFEYVLEILPHAIRNR